MPFLLPIEFDAETRLKKGALRDIESYDQEIRKYVEEAIGILEKAIQTDPKYLNSQINLGCAYILLNNFNLAIGTADKLLNNPTPKISPANLSRLYTLRGLGYYYTGDAKKAQVALVQAKETDNTNLTSYNILVLDSLEKGPIDGIIDQLFSLFSENKPEEQPKSPPNPLNEKIGNKTTNQIGLAESRETINIEKDYRRMTISYNKLPFYTDLIISSNTVQLKALSTNFGYTGKTTEDLGLYDTVNVLYKRYGKPTYIIEALHGKYIVYRKWIIFYVNNNDKIKKWWIYQFN